MPWLDRYQREFDSWVMREDGYDLGPWKQEKRPGHRPAPG